jgi:5-dehydro-2-deoxygluconokinase
VAIGNREEVAVVVGAGEPEEMAERLRALGPEIAIVKLGGEGVVVAWDGGSERIAPVVVEVVNGLGAGDAFGGAVCHGLLSGWTPPEVVRFANAAGAYVAARLACADAMPDERAVRALLNEQSELEVSR